MTNMVTTPTAPPPQQGLGLNLTNAPTFTTTYRPPPNPEDEAIQSAALLDRKGDLPGALAAVSAVIAADPKKVEAYSLRGEIYSKMKDWDKTLADYKTILQLAPNNIPATFNLSEVQFMQKDYQGARPGFVALVKDADWGDLAAYKVFLCDLFGGHEDVARGELDAFNATEANPSYYYGNAAWFLFHKRPDDARSWVISGSRIYAPRKVYLYSSSLFELGYLPLPQASN